MTVERKERVTELDPKGYLKQYRETVARIQSLADHREELRTECDSLKRQSGERVRLDAAVAHLVDTDKEIERQTDRMKLLQQEVSRIILMVTDADRRILLTLVYIEGKSLVETADIMTYSYRQAKRIHRKALHDVAEILAQDAQASRSAAV